VPRATRMQTRRRRQFGTFFIATSPLGEIPLQRCGVGARSTSAKKTHDYSEMSGQSRSARDSGTAATREATMARLELERFETLEPLAQPCVRGRAALLLLRPEKNRRKAEARFLLTS
jgi:hypothetical protein